MKQTALHSLHSSLGAKMVPFAGFSMPVQYPKGIIQEHHAVRTAVGMFDVSHMGEVEIHGTDALAFIQRITINDASKLEENKAQYSAMCYPEGGIVDDLLVYHCGSYYMLVINASNIEKDLDWMRQHATGLNVEIRDRSDEFSLLAVQGPHSLATLQKLTDVALEEIPYYNFRKGVLAGKEMIISRTGYTGEIGFELYFTGDTAAAEGIWNAIMEAGAEFGIEPVGLGARDTLRLEKGYCLYGNDIDQTTNPLEAGLGWITKLAKGDFVGKEAIAAVKAEGKKRQLVGLSIQADKFIARHGYEIMANDTVIGVVTSGSLSPTLNKPIALGYVDVAFSAPDTEVMISARGKQFPAVVAKFPFC